MRHEREKPVSRHERSDINPLRSFSFVEFIGAPQFSLPRDTGEAKEKGLRETRLALRRENPQDDGEDQLFRKENGHKPDGFEPFVDPQDHLRPPQHEEVLFVNKYNGNFAQRMELNRRGVERILKIAHLDGQVTLSSFVQSRSRSEVQGNELAAKRFLLFERKTQKPEEENPYKRVVSTPEGWRIEVNDQRITEELTERELAGERLQREFIKRFNMIVRNGIGESVRREKLSSEKDKAFWSKLFVSAVNPALALFYSGKTNFDPVSVSYQIGIVMFMYSLFNITGKLFPTYPFIRKIDHTWEYLMPRVEIDKVGRTFAYLSPVIGKGRTLVRERKKPL